MIFKENCTEDYIYGLSTKELKELLDRINTELLSRQTECKHRRIIYEYGANTGNYAPSDDCYWVTVECIDCGNRTTYYDHDEGYEMKYVGEDLKATKEEWEVLKKFGKGL